LKFFVNPRFVYNSRKEVLHVDTDIFLPQIQD
jgi:hypothetical protein